MKKGRVFNFQHFSNEDGPGIRTTVFLQGCNLHCPWCHNPESQSYCTEIMFFRQKCIGCGRCIKVCPQKMPGGEFCLHCGACAETCPAEARVAYGKEMTVDEVVEEVIQDKDMYEISGGGVTFSGGEPLLQAEFLEEILKEIKKADIHTAVETAGCYESQRLERIHPYLDHIFMDLKCLDDEKHVQIIGASNKQILKNIQMAGEWKIPFVIRIPVICGFNESELPLMADWIDTHLPEHVKVELMAYHDMCSGKYEALNRRFAVDGFRKPKEAEMQEFRILFGNRIT